MIQRRAATSQYDTCSELLGIARLLNLRPYILGNIGHTRLNNGCEVQTLDRLDCSAAALYGDKLVGSDIHHRRAIATLQGLNHLHWDSASIGANIGINHRTTHRDSGNVTQHAARIYRNVGYTATDINHCYTLLLLVAVHHRLANDRCTSVELTNLDAYGSEYTQQTLTRLLVAENEVVG